VIATLPWVAGWALGRHEWVKPITRATVGLVQGNIAQSAKWEPESVAPILATYRDLSDAAWGRDIVVWPEAAVTLFVEQARVYLDAMSDRASRAGSALVLGIPDVERMPHGPPLFLNTALALGLGDGQYAKRRLVPFGEYVPFEQALRGLIAFFDLPMSHAVAGAERQPPLQLKSSRAAVAICYEIVYPELVRESAKTADVLITISNDTWFGRSLGPLQHMEMAQMRALENGRWLLRATNDGVTAIVDARGHIVKSLPRFEPGVLTGEFSVMTGQTPFTRFGTLPVVVVLAAMSFVGRTRRSA
jgi:apolipoprotein N-acyltransferase